jgi:alpha-glucosidase
MQLDSGAPAVRPGDFVMPDYTREGARTWWSGLIDTWAKSGAAGFTVPRRDSFTLPAGVALRADRGLGGPAGGDQYQFVLPTLFARATAAGAGGEKANRRPLVLAATPALTLQRSAAIVVPAERASWESLQSLIPTILNTTMSGHPLVGVEIPDFRDSDPELARRWSGLAATFPLSVGTFAASPENPMLTEEFKKVHAAALQRRYRLIPYYYTLCFDAFFSCQPIVLPLFFRRLGRYLASNPAGRVLDRDGPAGRAAAQARGQESLAVPAEGEVEEGGPWCR